MPIKWKLNQQQLEIVRMNIRKMPVSYKAQILKDAMKEKVINDMEKTFSSLFPYDIDYTLELIGGIDAVELAEVIPESKTYAQILESEDRLDEYLLNHSLSVGTCSNDGKSWYLTDSCTESVQICPLAWNIDYYMDYLNEKGFDIYSVHTAYLELILFNIVYKVFDVPLEWTKIGVTHAVTPFSLHGAWYDAYKMNLDNPHELVTWGSYLDEMLTSLSN